MFLLLNLMFFLALVLTVYHFILFPLGLLTISFFSRPKAIPPYPEDELPAVALMIAARNEAKSIRAKLENSLALNYPKDKLRIIVLANGCTDNTVEICRSYADRGVEVFEFGDIGKGRAQNLGVEKVDSDIVVFSDANTPYNRNAIRHLVAPFRDPKVGAVSGQHLYVNLDMATGATEGAYWNILEYALKKAESRTGGLIGANGAISSIRRDLYIPMPPGVITDMFEPLLIAAQGYRTVYAPDAIAEEHAEATFEAEYRRKELVVQRTAHSLFFFYPWLLNPSRTGRIAFLLWSHKVLRWFAPALIMLMVLISLVRLLAGRGGKRDVAVFTGASLLGFLATLGYGLGKEKPLPVLSHALYLVMMFKAATLGLYKAFTKGGVVVWDHHR